MTVGPGVLRSSRWVDESLKLMGRGEAEGGAAVVRADISSINVTVTNAAGTETLSSTALDKTAVWFDTLQTNSDDADWDEDTTGYNFKYIVPKAAFPAVGVYRVVVDVIPVSGSGELFSLVAENTTFSKT